MPKGHQGQKRPGDVIGAAVTVAKIATGEIEDTRDDPAKAHHREGGLNGGCRERGKAHAPGARGDRQVSGVGAVEQDQLI